MIENIFKLHELIKKEELLNSLISLHRGPDINFKNQSWPLLSLTMGSSEPQAPVLFIVGGVHGLEKIGAELCWTFLKTTTDRLLWDQSLRDIFKKIRIVFIPLLNPYGYYNHRRSNNNGVDLMRNSTVDAIDRTPWLLGGHRISPKLPWYRGVLDSPREIETQFLYEQFRKFALQSHCVVSVDFHSGFGMRDRLWFPYSHKKAAFENLSELTALIGLFEKTYPYHIYKIEPQSEGYLLNGDLWDFLYLEFNQYFAADKSSQKNVFIPLTLEMGSWTWVRKNPIQIFSRHGAFNPMKEHRQKRTYRRHHLLFDFLLRSLYSHESWSELDSLQSTHYNTAGRDLWYK